MSLTQRIVIEGNDGVGKSTLVERLRAAGFRRVEDRGEMTKATLDPSVALDPEAIYILLVCPWELSRARLISAGKDMTEEWHTDEALKHFDQVFRSLAPRFNAVVIDTEQDSPGDCYIRALSALPPLRLGCSSGRLHASAFGSLFGGSARQACVPFFGHQRLYARSKTYPQMVALGVLDYAVVGQDALEGNPYASLIEILDEKPQIGEGKIPIRIALASRSGTIPQTPLLRVATPFPEWAQRILGERGIPHTVFAVAGSSEVLVSAEMADVVFDVVETGRTLRENHLVIIEECGPLMMYLIGQRRQ